MRAGRLAIAPTSSPWRRGPCATSWSTRRGGGPEAPLALDEAEVAAPQPGAQLLALDAALARLAADDPELARVVEWRFFGGFSVEEIAAALEVSDRTVKRQWRAARAFLHRQLTGEGPAP